MKKLLFILAIGGTVFLTSCKDGSSFFGKGKEAEAKILALETEISALKKQLTACEEQQVNEIMSIRSDYEAKLAELQEQIEKIVLKLRGAPPKVSNFFLFKLESLFIKRNIDVMISDPKLLSIINRGHDFLNYLFVTSLTKYYHGKIGLTIEDAE